MKRKFVGFLAATVLLFVATGAFAYEQKSREYPWMASFNKTGQLNLYAAIGFYYYGFNIDGGPELILGNFSVTGVPFEWGVAAKAMIGFANWNGSTWLDWGLGPLVTLHWGIDGGGLAKFDFYVGLGLGVSGATANYVGYGFGSGVGFGFATSDGVAWHFSQNISAILDYSYFGYNSLFGIGLRFNL